MCVCVLVTQSNPTLQSHELCAWNSPGKNTGVGCHFLLQGIFSTQGLSPGLLHCRQILSRLGHKYSGVKKTFSNTSRNLSSVLALKQTGSILWFSRTQVSYYKTQNEYPQLFFHFKTTRFHFHLFHFLKCLSLKKIEL